VNVFLNPGSQNFPRSGVKKSLYRVEHLDHPMFAPDLQVDFCELVSISLQ
jgi:hypothetical protein